MLVKVSECVLSKSAKLVGIIVPKGAVVQPKTGLSALLEGEWADSSVHFLKDQDGTFGATSHLDGEVELVSLSNVYDWLTSLIRLDAQRVERTGVLVIAEVSGDEEAKCLFVQGRRVINSNPGTALVLVVIGAWNYFAIRECWAAQGSPLEPAHLKFCLGLEDLQISRLMEKTGLGSLPDRLTVQKMVLSETAGAEWICSDIVNELARRVKSQEGSAPAVSDVIADVQESPQTIEQIRAFWSLLTSKQSEMVLDLLRRRCAKASDAHMADAFKLWLLGLAQLRYTPSLTEKTLWLHPPSPLIERCLRHSDILSSKQLESIGPPKNLLLSSPDVNVKVYLAIFRVENFLRDLIASFMQVKYGDKWLEERLCNVYTSMTHAGGSASKMDVQKLVDARLVEIGLLEEKELPVTKAGKKHISVHDAIVAARKRMAQMPAKRTKALTDLAFLTFNDIILILTDETLYHDCFAVAFKNKSYLVSLLSEIKEIRNAMAHNNPLKTSVLAEVAQLERKLIDMASIKLE